MDILPSFHLSLFKTFLPFRAQRTPTHRTPAPFENLPNEILLNVFQRIRNDTASGTFIDSLLVCRRCHEIGTKILWQDLVLTNDSIGLFVEHVSTLPKCPPVRSLTVRLVFTRPTREEFSADLQHQLFKGSTTNPRMVVLDQLATQLAGLMKKHFHTLTTFSILIKRNTFTPHSCVRLEWDSGVSSNLINTLLLALPPVCTSVEIDTGGLDNCFDPEQPPEHLCCTIRSLLPQLYHLRLRMHRYCPSLVDPTHDSQVALNSETPTRDEPIHFQAPLLQTLILSLSPESPTRDAPVNLRAPHSQTIVLNSGLELVRDRPHLCGGLQKHIRSTFIKSSPHHPNNLRFILAAALRDALDRDSFPAIKRLEIFNIRSRFPAIKHLEIFNDRSRHGKDSSHFSRQDILAAETLILPLHLLAPDHPECSYQPGGLYTMISAEHKPRFGLVSALEHEVEQAWHTTTTGSRFPTAFRHSADAGFEWHVPRLVGLEDLRSHSIAWQRLWVVDDLRKKPSWNEQQVRKRLAAISWKEPEVAQGCGEEAFQNW